jgi:hypothetical protein
VFDAAVSVTPPRDSPGALTLARVRIARLDETDHKVSVRLKTFSFGADTRP